MKDLSVKPGSIISSLRPRVALDIKVKIWNEITLARVIAGVPATAEVVPGKITGGQKYDMPAWFKMSFLDLKDDLKEANAHGRQLLLFLHLEECPYCARMLNENFREGATREFIERHFDVIGIDIRG